MAQAGSGGNGGYGINTANGGNGADGGRGQGGAIFNHSNVILSNCTLTGNTANGGNGSSGGNSGFSYGGNAGYGANPGSPGHSYHVTPTEYGHRAMVVGAGEDAIFSSGTATLINTIVAGNGGGDVAGTLATASSNNLIGGGPLLGPLGNYGGLTQTIPLLPGSPAIDAATSGAGIPAADQRGQPRVGATDMGAFESQGFTLAAVPGSTPQASQNGGFANPLAMTVTANSPLEPVNGGLVSFTVPTTGPSAVLPTSSVTIAGGIASTSAIPNPTVRDPYTVSATSSGSNTVSFSLVNSPNVIVVNTTGDSIDPLDGLTSLREAILYANSHPVVTIIFDATVFATAQTITLGGSQLELTDTTGTTTISGPPAGVTISGNNASRVFQVDAGVTAGFSGLTITGGKASLNAILNADGGGLLNYGTTTLTNCTISGSSGTAGCIAAIRVQSLSTSVATAVLTNCTIGNNTSVGIAAGGGTSRGTLLNTIVAGNNGGGADVSGSTFTSKGHNLIGNIGTTTGWNASDLTGAAASPLNLDRRNEHDLRRQSAQRHCQLGQHRQRRRGRGPDRDLRRHQRHELRRLDDGTDQRRRLRGDGQLRRRRQPHG